MLRLAVRFLISAMPTPVLLRSLTVLWAAKCFLPSPAFTLDVWCATGWVAGASQLKLCPAGRFHHRPPHCLREACSLQAGGWYLTEVVNKVPLLSALWHLLTQLRIPGWEKSKTRSASPISLTSLCVFSWEPCCWKRSISSQCLIVLHNDNILCCGELPSS